jgi:hypothetical protein
MENVIADKLNSGRYEGLHIRVYEVYEIVPCDGDHACPEAEQKYHVEKLKDVLRSYLETELRAAYPGADVAVETLTSPAEGGLSVWGSDEVSEDEVWATIRRIDAESEEPYDIPEWYEDEEEITEEIG